MGDEAYYLQAHGELAAGKAKPDLKAKAFALSNGVPGAAESIYVKLRAEQMMREAEAAQKGKNTFLLVLGGVVVAAIYLFIHYTVGADERKTDAALKKFSQRIQQDFEGNRPDLNATVPLSDRATPAELDASARRAFELFPDLANGNSALAVAVNAEWDRLKAQNSPKLFERGFPEKLTREVAASLGIAPR